jgi:hypothetical protein
MDKPYFPHINIEATGFGKETKIILDGKDISGCVNHYSVKHNNLPGLFDVELHFLASGGVVGAAQHLTTDNKKSSLRQYEIEEVDGRTIVLAAYDPDNPESQKKVNYYAQSLEGIGVKFIIFPDGEEIYVMRADKIKSFRQVIVR